MKTFNLKKLSTLIALTATLTTGLSNSALAARSENQQAALEGGTVTTAAIAGALTGGPLGAMVGSIIGMLFADQTRKTNDANLALNTNQIEMTQLTQELTSLSHDIEIQEFTIAKLEQKTVDKLALQVLFNTADDTLNEQDLSRLETLAQHLRANDELIINLIGHSDPRGAKEYNNALALDRANTVKETLVELGVADSRIMTNSFGAEQSTAQAGQYDQYARDRRVDINIINQRNMSTMANAQPTSEATHHSF